MKRDINRILLFYEQENRISSRCKDERDGRTTHLLAICMNEYE